MRFHAVERGYPLQKALDGIDLNIAAKERIALIGPSGSGKSTVLALASGALAPSAGRIMVDGIDIAQMSYRTLDTHRKRCAVIPQGGGLVEQLSVHDSVVAGLLPQWPWYRVLLSRLRPLERARVSTWLSKVGLDTRQDSLVGELSGGEKQRVAIARALISQASFMLADEPTSSLDPHLGKQVAQLLFDQARELKSTLLVATHWVSLARRLAQRIVGLQTGRIVIDAASDEVTDADIEQLYAGSDERH